MKNTYSEVLHESNMLYGQFEFWVHFRSATKHRFWCHIEISTARDMFQSNAFGWRWRLLAYGSVPCMCVIKRTELQMHAHAHTHTRGASVCRNCETGIHVRLINLLFSAYLFASNEEIADGAALLWTVDVVRKSANEWNNAKFKEELEEFHKMKTTSEISKFLRLCHGDGSGGTSLPLRITYCSLYPYHVCVVCFFVCVWVLLNAVVEQFTEFTLRCSCLIWLVCRFVNFPLDNIQHWCTHACSVHGCKSKCVRMNGLLTDQTATPALSSRFNQPIVCCVAPPDTYAIRGPFEESTIEKYWFQFYLSPIASYKRHTYFTSIVTCDINWSIQLYSQSAASSWKIKWKLFIVSGLNRVRLKLIRIERIFPILSQSMF